MRQLIQCFQRAATSEQSQTISIASDSLFVNFAQVMSKSVHIEDEDEGDDEGELDQAVSFSTEIRTDHKRFVLEKIIRIW